METENNTNCLLNTEDTILICYGCKFSFQKDNTPVKIFGAGIESDIEEHDPLVIKVYCLFTKEFKGEIKNCPLNLVNKINNKNELIKEIWVELEYLRNFNKTLSATNKVLYDELEIIRNEIAKFNLKDEKKNGKQRSKRKRMEGKGITT